MAEELNVDLTHGIKKLEIFSKNFLKTKFFGQYKSTLKGKGLEFSNFRDYTYQDDSSRIDWKTTARMNKPMIKEYIDERNLEVFFLIDVSSSMVFGSTKKLKNEYVAELIAALSYGISNVGDSVGYALFSDTITHLTPPSLNKNIFYTLTKTLITPENYGGSYNFEFALDKVTKLLKENTILIIVSDFIGLKGNWKEYLKKGAYKLDIIGIMIRDPRDNEIPEDSDMIILADPYTDQQIILDPTPITRAKYKSYTEKQELDVENTFTKSRASFLKLTTDKPFLPYLIAFFKKRQKWSR